MNLKVLTYCIAMAMLPASLRAQSGFRSASIVNLKGDTTLGLIKYEGWSRSPLEIQFKQNGQSEAVTLLPKDIKSFDIPGVEKYVSYIGPVSINKIDAPDIPYIRDSTTKQVAAFLNVVTSGANVTLLAHRDEIKTAYFVKDKENTPQELKFYRYYNDADRIVTSAPFRQVLISLLEKYRGVNEKWYQQAGVAGYTSPDLRKLVNSVNNDQSKEVSTWGYRFYVGAVAAYQHITFDGPERYRYERVNNAMVPVLNIGYDFYANKFTPKAVFRVEASVTNISSSFEGPYTIFYLKAVVVSLKPQVLYSFNPTNKVRPFIGAGVAVNVPFESENSIIANPKAVPEQGTQTILINGDTRGAIQVGQIFKRPFLSSTVFVNPEIKAGVSFNKKFEAVATAALKGTNILRSLQPLYINYYSFGLNYYFGGKR